MQNGRKHVWINLRVEFEASHLNAALLTAHGCIDRSKRHLKNVDTRAPRAYSINWNRNLSLKGPHHNLSLEKSELKNQTESNYCEKKLIAKFLHANTHCCVERAHQSIASEPKIRKWTSHISTVRNVQYNSAHLDYLWGFTDISPPQSSSVPPTL